MRHLLHLAYNGGSFKGWQRQKNTSDTIQQIIEEKLSILARSPITIIGCGRTDKGVHAQQFYAHMDYAGDTDPLVYKLNRMLPRDIVIYDILPVKAGFNARFAATERTYRYFFHLRPDPFLSKLSAYYHVPDIRIDDILSLIRLLPKYKEYRAFCKTPDKVDNTLCTIMDTHLYADPNKERFCFEITANRFLRGMIRVLMHYILEVAQGKKTIAQIEEMLKTGTNTEEIQYAHPQGLYLHKIVYPEIRLTPNKELTEFLWEGMEELV